MIRAPSAAVMAHCASHRTVHALQVVVLGFAPHERTELLWRNLIGCGSVIAHCRSLEHDYSTVRMKLAKTRTASNTK